MRVVLDPGVLVSAFIARDGPPLALFDAWGEGRFELVVSPHLLAELEDVLRRPKLARYASAEASGAFIALIRERAMLIDDPDVVAGVTPDPDDDYLIALARASGSHVVVSGDRALVEARGIAPAVVTPRKALDLLE